MLCILLVAMAFLVTQGSAAATNVSKVKVIPVPWQEWRVVWDPAGQQVIGVDDIIFFDPPEMPEEAVAIVRWFVVLEYQIPLEDLTWEETENLPWMLVDYEPYILHLDEEVHLFIPTEETDEAVLVRYTVAWASNVDVPVSVFVNEALLESRSPQAIVGSLSNFEVHNCYHEPIDNFELELYGNIVPGDIIGWYDEPGPPYVVPGVFGPVWFGGWGAPPVINTLPGGVEIIWIDEENPVQPCEWIHFGVSLRLVKKVMEIPAPVQFWQQFVGGVTDIIVFGDPTPSPTETPEEALIVRDYVVLPYEIPLEELTWEGTENLDWIPIDDPADPRVVHPGEVVTYDIPTTEEDEGVLVRYTVNWMNDPTGVAVQARFVNEALLESHSPQVIRGQLMNFDVHNCYTEPVDNFELELYGISPWDIVDWFPGWGTPPHIIWLPDGTGTEVLWMDRNRPIPPCQWVHFGLNVIPGVIGTGARAHWTQTLELTGAKAYLTQIVEDEPTKWALLVAPVRLPWELCLKDDISDMRNYLLQRGWDDDHIIFLTTETVTEGQKAKLPKGDIEWAEGQNQGSKGSASQEQQEDEWWIDGDATWQNVKNALDALESGGTYQFWHSTGDVTQQTFNPSDEDDIIYMSFKDHGGRYLDGQRPPPLTDPRPGDETEDDYDGMFCTYGNTLDPWDPLYFWYDDEMDIELDQITYDWLVFEMMACHAGEFLPDCAGTMRLVCLSCQEYESSYGVPPYYDLYDGLTQAPDDYLVDDGFVSVEEAHQWEVDTMPVPYQNPISDDQIPGETQL
jgi:hypothetical protein